MIKQWIVAMIMTSASTRGQKGPLKVKRYNCHLQTIGHIFKSRKISRWISLAWEHSLIPQSGMDTDYPSLKSTIVVADNWSHLYHLSVRNCSSHPQLRFQAIGHIYNSKWVSYGSHNLLLLKQTPVHHHTSNGRPAPWGRSHRYSYSCNPRDTVFK